MPIFCDAEALYTCIGGLFERMQSQPQTQDLLHALKLTVRFTFTHPDASIVLTSRDDEQFIHYGDSDEKSDVELIMSGDVAHQFWMGDINVMGAIAKRQITPIGPLSKIMKLKPLIKSAIEIYPLHFMELKTEKLADSGCRGIAVNDERE